MSTNQVRSTLYLLRLGICDDCDNECIQYLLSGGVGCVSCAPDYISSWQVQARPLVLCNVMLASQYCAAELNSLRATRNYQTRSKCYMLSSWPELFASVLSAPAELPHVSSFRDTEGPGWRAEQTQERHVTAKLFMFRVTWQWHWRDRRCSGHKERNGMYFMTTGKTSILLLCLLHISSITFGTSTGYCDIEFWREHTGACTHDRWHPGPLSHRPMALD